MKHGCLRNSHVLYHSQQAVIFFKQGDRSIAGSKRDPGLPGLDGGSVPCPLVRYRLSLFLHGLCVFLLWPSPVPRSESLQAEEGHKAAELEQDVSLWHSGQDASVLCLLPTVTMTLDKERSNGRPGRGCLPRYGNRC